MLASITAPSFKIFPSTLWQMFAPVVIVVELDVNLANNISFCDAVLEVLTFVRLLPKIGSGILIRPILILFEFLSMKFISETTLVNSSSTFT